MAKEIVNRVAQSSLEVFDLSDYWPKGGVQTLDLRHLAPEGVLRETHVRELLATIDSSPFDQAVVRCILPDAIIPQWLWPMLGHLLQNAQFASPGDEVSVLSAYYAKALAQVDWSQWTDAKVLLKGCSDVDIPESAFIVATQELSKVVSKLMYGEACSFVPIMNSRP